MRHEEHISAFVGSRLSSIHLPLGARVKGPAKAGTTNEVSQNLRRLVSRWLKFNVVGAAGIVVQSSVLTLLVRLIGLNYLLATALAVEAAVIHNFVWHLRWTWADRVGRPSTMPRHTGLSWLVRFNLTTGAISIMGNLLFMRLLVGVTGIGVLKANLATIALCSFANFILSDRVVFRSKVSRRSR